MLYAVCSELCDACSVVGAVLVVVVGAVLLVLFFSMGYFNISVLHVVIILNTLCSNAGSALDSLCHLLRAAPLPPFLSLCL